MGSMGRRLGAATRRVVQERNTFIPPHLAICSPALLLSYIMVCPAPLTVSHPFGDTHPRTSRALRHHPWGHVLGQRLYACSLWNTAPSALLQRTGPGARHPTRDHTQGFRKESNSSPKIGIAYSKGKESAGHTAQSAAARSTSGARGSKERARHWRDAETHRRRRLPVRVIDMLYCDTPVCGNESKENSSCGSNQNTIKTSNPGHFLKQRGHTYSVSF